MDEGKLVILQRICSMFIWRSAPATDFAVAPCETRAFSFVLTTIIANNFHKFVIRCFCGCRWVSLLFARSTMSR